MIHIIKTIINTNKFLKWIHLDVSGGVDKNENQKQLSDQAKKLWEGMKNSPEWNKIINWISKTAKDSIESSDSDIEEKLKSFKTIWIGKAEQIMEDLETAWIDNASIPKNTRISILRDWSWLTSKTLVTSSWAYTPYFNSLIDSNSWKNWNYSNPWNSNQSRININWKDLWNNYEK